MKTLPEGYIAKDENDTRQPCEIYDCWLADNSLHWRYTSGDAPIVFENEEYTHAAIKRSTIKYNDAARSLQMTLTAPFLSEPALHYLGTNPVDIIWIHVRKIFRDQDPYEAQSIYIGTVASVGFKGNLGQITCTGFDHFLSQPVPKERTQPSCNVFPFTDKCGLIKANYQSTFTSDLESTDVSSITDSEFALFDDDYFTWGWVETETTSRLITSHVESTIHVRYPFSVSVGEVLNIYPGCNGQIETCYDKYNNVINFRGMAQVPVHNPVVWRK